MKCYDCPRECGVDRNQNLGYCREKNKIRVSKVIENFMWEEPCISGEKGALAIFFSGCNLRCSFCQNYEISHVGKGDYYTAEEFRKFILSFDLEKYASIDLVTPTHFSSLLIEALSGLNLPIPVVWNSNGYEKVEIIEKLVNIVDVFLVDFKYVDIKLSKQLSYCEDYFDYASKVVIKMTTLKQNIIENGIMKQGVLIRHLVLPGYSKDSFKVLDFIKDNIAEPFIALMSQFTPTTNSSIKNKLLPLEFKAVLAHAEKCGLNDGYFQDLSSSSCEFVPKF